MPIYDRDQLSEVQLRVLEPNDLGVSFPSGFWTATEVLQYFNQRQARFIKDTKLNLALQSISVLAFTERVALPADWIATVRASWLEKNATGGYIASQPLSRNDRFAADHGWGTSDTPQSPLLFDDIGPSAPAADLLPAPQTNGELRLLYSALAESFDGAGTVLFTVPEEYVPYITYGVLADMLGKHGRGQDLARAAYCESRYQEGVGLTVLLLGGFV